jgi:thioredoxin 1
VSAKLKSNRLQGKVEVGQGAPGRGDPVTGRASAKLTSSRFVTVIGEHARLQERDCENRGATTNRTGGFLGASAGPADAGTGAAAKHKPPVNGARGPIPSRSLGDPACRIATGIFGHFAYHSITDRVQLSRLRRAQARTPPLWHMASSSVLHLTETNFYQTVRETQVPVLVDFWATWCGPCRMIAPVLDEIATEQGEKVRVVKIDVDNNRKLAEDFRIKNIPTLLFFKGGELRDQVVGLTSKADLISRLDSLK